MTSGWLGACRPRFDAPETDLAHGVQGPSFSSSTAAPSPKIGRNKCVEIDARRLESAVGRTRDWLLAQQHNDGHWVGELEGDTILESEYILLLAFLGEGRSRWAKQAANYILEKQLPDGGWAIYPGGPLEISASVKAYFALKITGHPPETAEMTRAREAILQAGGAEQVNSFTRYYLALLGVISYEQCPAVPPELVLIPRWMPFNIYEMSAWSRTILVPLSLLWAFRPLQPLPPEQGIRELFTRTPEELPVTMATSEVLDDLRGKSWIDWDRMFRRLDRLLKILDRYRLRPLRGTAIRRATEWMLTRFENSDGLGAIFPPIIWSVVGLKCLGYADDSPEVQTALRELEKLHILEGDSLRLQPCKSPVWDTAIATIALREAEVPAEHPAIGRAVDWLLSKEVRRRGDWAVLNAGHEAGGWFFEYNNEFYPDVDDTSMVLMAFTRCQPTDEIDENSPGADSPVEKAVQRGLRWILAMQNRDGGWGAFDRNNDRELFTRVPFADHNAMIDPSTADLTARNLEMFAGLNIPRDHPAVRQALDYVWREQEADHCWYGRWGVNYLYGTWQSLVGLTAIGVPADDPRIRKAAEWVKAKQQDCGGWGETPRSYDEPELRGQGEPTASQTAWALMGLMAAGEADSEAVRRGVGYLLNTQREDGTWDEPWFTGTGFPRVFYLNYHLYRISFPLMALGKYNRWASKIG